MTPVEYMSCGLVVSMISGMAGHYIGSKGKVGNSTCTERREACVKNINTKLDSIAKEISDIKHLVVNGNRRQ